MGCTPRAGCSGFFAAVLAADLASPPLAAFFCGFTGLETAGFGATRLPDARLMAGFAEVVRGTDFAGGAGLVGAWRAAAAAGLLGDFLVAGGLDAFPAVAAGTASDVSGGVGFGWVFGAGFATASALGAGFSSDLASDLGAVVGFASAATSGAAFSTEAGSVAGLFAVSDIGVVFSAGFGALADLSADSAELSFFARRLALLLRGAALPAPSFTAFVPSSASSVFAVSAEGSCVASFAAGTVSSGSFGSEDTKTLVTCAGMAYPGLGAFRTVFLYWV